jgi:tetratricopeptide (TPR) repeat protein
MWEDDPEAMDIAIVLHDALLAEAVAAGGGWFVNHRGEGDSTFSVFDDPALAIRTAVEAQRALASAAWPGPRVRVRMGVHMGEAVAREGDYFGVTVNRAARIRGVADGDEIAVSAITADAAGGLGEDLRIVPGGEFALRGITRPEPISFVQWGATRSEAERSHLRVVPLTDAPEAAAPFPFPITPPDRYVGRRSEQERLGTLWERACSGALELAFLLGEPGIGKTALAGHFARDCHARGAVVLAGRCDEVNLVPFQPVVEALGCLKGTALWSQAQRRLGRDAEDLHPLLPNRALDSRRAPVDSDPEVRRYRMFEAVSQLLGDLATHHPLVVLLDDLQWADEPTLALLHHVVRANRSGRILVLGTVRDTVLTAASPLTHAMVLLGREASLQRVHLEGLSADEIIGLLLVDDDSDVSVGARDQALASALQRDTAGNPLFVREVIQHLRDTGSLARESGEWRTPTVVERLEVPERVQDVIGERLTHLREPTQQLLVHAAVLGPEFSLPVLEEMTELDEDTLLGSIDEALAARFLLETDDADRFEFAHALVRTGVYARISTSRRARLHARAGRAIEALHGNDLAPVAADLSHHFHRAGSVDHDGRARSYAVLAARTALSHLAFEDAARLFTQALEDPQAPPLEDAARVDLLLLLGSAHWSVGAVTAARGAFTRAADGARAINDVTALAHAALGFAGDGVRFWWIELAVVNQQAIDLLEEAHAALVENPALRARVQACLAQELFFTEGTRERRLQLSADALDLARQVADPRTLAAVLADRNLAIFDSDHIEERLRNADELVAIGRRLGDPQIELYGQAHHGAGSAQAGDLRRSGEDAAAALALAQELRQPHYIGIVRVCQGFVRQNLGDLDEGERLALEGFRIGREREDPNALLVFAGQILTIRRDQDRLHELIGLMERMTAAHPGIPGLWSVIALARAELGHRDQAREALHKLVRPSLDRLPRDSIFLPALCALGESAVLLEDRPSAAAVYEELQPYARMNAVIGAFGSWGVTSTVLGLLAAHLGRADEADAHARGAIEMTRRIGSRFQIARALVTDGEIAHRAGDLDRARASARAVLDELGPVGPDVTNRARALIEGRIATPGEGAAEAAGVVSRARSAVSLGGRSALARLTRSAADDALVRNVRSATAQRALFTALARSYQPSFAYGFTGNIVIELDTTLPGSDPTVDVWTLEVGPRRARARRGPATPAATTVQLTVADFVRLVAGSLDPIQAFKAGRLTVDGDVLLAARMDELFGGVSLY